MHRWRGCRRLHDIQIHSEVLGLTSVTSEGSKLKAIQYLIRETHEKVTSILRCPTKISWAHLRGNPNDLDQQSMIKAVTTSKRVWLEIGRNKFLYVIYCLDRMTSHIALCMLKGYKKPASLIKSSTTAVRAVRTLRALRSDLCAKFQGPRRHSVGENKGTWHSESNRLPVKRSPHRRPTATRFHLSLKLCMYTKPFWVSR